MKTRIMLIVSVAVLALAVTGCYSAPQGPAKGTGSSESTAAPNQYSASQSSAGVALGTDLQRTAEAKLGGKLWAMSISGQAGLAGENPVITLAAVDGKGARKVIETVKADGTAGMGSVQRSFVVPIPSGTRQFVVTTTLRAKDATTAGPTLTIPLADVPKVDKLTLTGEGE